MALRATDGVARKIFLIATEESGDRLGAQPGRVPDRQPVRESSRRPERGDVDRDARRRQPGADAATLAAEQRELVDLAAVVDSVEVPGELAVGDLSVGKTMRRLSRTSLPCRFNPGTEATS